MLSNKALRYPLVISTSAAALAVLAPIAATAQPAPGSADGVISSGSAILDSGSAILDGGSIIDGAVDILNSGSSIINSLPGTGSLAPQQFCNQNTISGGAGVTQTRHDLGRGGPATFDLRWETRNIPDIIDVYYQGGLVFSTGYVGDNLNEGTGSALVSLPPGNDTNVLVKVTGPNGTVWDYTVGCPI